MPERAKIKVDSLSDLHELLDAHGYPGDLFLPLGAYFVIRDRTRHHGLDEIGEFSVFGSTRIRPPRFKSMIVDLSDAEVIDAPP